MLTQGQNFECLLSYVKLNDSFSKYMNGHGPHIDSYDRLVLKKIKDFNFCYNVHIQFI
jgi:hypothetical protein